MNTIILDAQIIIRILHLEILVLLQEQYWAV